jgi:PAS domain-containing protein
MTPETGELIVKGSQAFAVVALGWVVKLSTPRIKRTLLSARERRDLQQQHLAMIPTVLQSVTEIGSRVAMVEGRSWSHCQFDRNDAIFEADALGRWVRVNRALTAKTGRNSDELLGFEWLNLIDPADRARVRAEWHDAVVDGREFEQQCLITTRFVRAPMIVRALPSRRPCDSVVIGWNGRLWFDDADRQGVNDLNT